MFFFLLKMCRVTDMHKQKSRVQRVNIISKCIFKMLKKFSVILKCNLNYINEILTHEPRDRNPDINHGNTVGRPNVD